MKEKTKQERANKKALDWLAKMGKNVEDIKVEPVVVQSKRFPKEISLNMEACLKYWDNPTEWIEKKCQRCGKTFATLYYPVGNCSDTCRVRQLQDIGLQVNLMAEGHSRWGRVPPLVVPPEALTHLKELRDEQIHTLQPDALPQLESQSTDDPHTDQDFSLPELTSFE